MRERTAISHGRIQDVAGRIWVYVPDRRSWRWGDDETAIHLRWINLLAFRPLRKPWKELK